MNNLFKDLTKCFLISLLSIILILIMAFFIASHYHCSQTSVLFVIGLFILIFTSHLLITPEKETRHDSYSLFHPTLILIAEKNNKVVNSFDQKRMNI